MRINNSYLSLGHKFYSHQLPTPVIAPRLIKFNEELANELGVSETQTDAANIFSGNKIIDGFEPITQAYAGYQFGHFNILGDGRAILLGEILTSEGRFDIVLKGAGRTQFSRNGDGRAALGPVLREYIVSEFMFRAGVPTTRSLACVLTGEEIYREEMQKGAIITRIAKSHIRFGTFTYFAAHREIASLRQLADYSIERHFPNIADNSEKYLAFFEKICVLQAQTIAKWMGLGFIHGVMNTDNMLISGETIDYGPCAFMDNYKPSQTYSFIDKRGRYRYENQGKIAQWNLARLAEDLLLLFEDKEKAIEDFKAILESFWRVFESEYYRVFALKLGLKNSLNAQPVIDEFLSLLETNSFDFTNSFRYFTTIQGEGFDEWRNKWRELVKDDDEALKIANNHNPYLIPRNHQIQSIINAANNGDFAPFERMLEAIQKPFETNVNFKDLTAPPRPEEIVQHTFCGT